MRVLIFHYRPTCLEVSHHPFLWTDIDRLTFLQDASDRVEIEAVDSPLRVCLEHHAADIVGLEWNLRLHPGTNTYFGF